MSWSARTLWPSWFPIRSYEASRSSYAKSGDGLALWSVLWVLVVECPDREVEDKQSTNCWCAWEHWLWSLLSHHVVFQREHEVSTSVTHLENLALKTMSSFYLLYIVAQCRRWRRSLRRRRVDWWYIVCPLHIPQVCQTFRHYVCPSRVPWEV